MTFNGEKKEIVFNDKDNGRGSKSSLPKRKSSDRSASPTKRKKSSEASSSSSKHKLTDELSPDKETSSSSSLKHKSSEKSTSSDKKNSSSHKSSSSTKNKSSSLSFNSKSSSEHKSSEKSSSDDKSALKLEPKESEKHKSSKKSDSKSKSSSVNKLEEKAPENSSQKCKSSDKSKENPSDQSSAFEIKHKSSSSKSKFKSSEKSSSSLKLNKSSEISSSSSQSKRRKSSDETNIPNDLVTKEIQNLREENEKFLSKLVEKFKDETKKVFEGLSKGTVVIRSDLDDESKRQLAILNAEPIENYPDEDYEYILDINGLWVPKCRFEYFTDPKDNVLKFRKIADISQLAQRSTEGQKGKDYKAGCCSISKINENVASEEKFEKEAILVPNTEIPLHEIIGLTDPQQIMTNENIKVVSVKSEIVEDEILTKPINLFVPSTPNVDKQCPPDSKLNIKIKNIKLEPQPHCSKDIPPINVKQELNINSKEYFRISQQKSVHSEISAVENSDKSEILADMSEINRWIATKNKNHGFKDKEALNSMMTQNSLFSLFKCMGINCCYTTISYENFLEHLNIHKQSSIKDCFLNCAYCLDKSKDPIDLIEHYKNVHHNCIYQCSLCFYRAAEQQSVYDHQAHNHSSDIRKREILECPIVFPTTEKIEEEKARRKVEDIKECWKCECK